MKTKWTPSICVLIVGLAFSAFGQDNSGSNNIQAPVLKTRPPAAPVQQSQGTVYNSGSQVYGAPANAIPEGKRFIIKLKDTLDTKKVSVGKHFKAELREDLITPDGQMIPKGKTIKGHVAQFERGYTGGRMMIALDEIETRHGWAPLIGTVTGVPGDPSIKSLGDEGELAKRGPDKKRVITNVAIGVGVGAIAGSVLGGGKGAAIGSAAGAGLGTGTALLFKNSDLKLQKGTQLEVRLERDLVIPR